MSIKFLSFIQNVELMFSLSLIPTRPWIALNCPSTIQFVYTSEEHPIKILSQPSKYNIHACIKPYTFPLWILKCILTSLIHEWRKKTGEFHMLIPKSFALYISTAAARPYPHHLSSIELRYSTHTHISIIQQDTNQTCTIMGIWIVIYASLNSIQNILSTVSHLDHRYSD